MNYYNQQLGKLTVKPGESPFEAFERETLNKYYTYITAYEYQPQHVRAQWALENNQIHSNYTMTLHAVQRIETRDYINIIGNS